MAILKKYFKVDLDRMEQTRQDKEKDEGLWLKCKSCGKLVYKKKVRENNNVCPNCGEYFFLTAPERIQSLVDERSFEDISKPIVASDPLGFVDRQSYLDRIAKSQEATGLTNAIIVGSARIKGYPVVLAVMDFRYIGGSMGSVMGEQISYGIRCAAEERRPFILISSTGGARMQEGILSLMQMAKTTGARKLLEMATVPFISILTYPTTAGVEASIASLGDVTIAEKGALIGFTGQRVIEGTIGEKLSSDFQTDQFALEHGIVDVVVRREEMRGEIARVLSFFNGSVTDGAESN
ncbi:MAG: acetyl-CoA carboxylase, carboxyltransferase subunit beta [Candidatus Bipolaricaulia bacterium]